MCEECRQTPCHSRCPNSEEVGYETCSFCKQSIYEGEEYLEGMGSLLLHMECLEDMSVEDIKRVFRLDTYVMEY